MTSPYEWYYIQARLQTENKMQRVISAYRDVLRQYTSLPNPTNVTYNIDEDQIEWATDLYTDFVDILKYHWGSYNAHIKDWKITCLFNKSLRLEIEQFTDE
jgi:hypothetical protein